MPWELNRLMGFGLIFYRLKLENPIFSGFETRSKVRQADIQLRTMKEDLIDTKLSLDLLMPMQKLKLTIVSSPSKIKKKTHN
jgi:hypothetical protein